MFQYKYKLYTCILPFLCLMGFSGCNSQLLATDSIASSSDDTATALTELAYDAGAEHGIVYIDENGVYAPYLVLSANYDDNVLLLRENLLENTMPYNRNDRHMWASYEYGGYYEGSSIDVYLNTKFFNELAKSAQDAIVESEIIVTDKSSLGVTGDKAIPILRKVFLLSLTELNGAKSYASVTEGDTQKYFEDDYTRRIATLPNGDDCAYWTRTPETWETYTVFTIGKGGVGSGSADIDSGVRPAFCLKASTKITQRTDIVDGKTVYAIQ